MIAGIGDVEIPAPGVPDYIIETDESGVSAGPILERSISSSSRKSAYDAIAKQSDPGTVAYTSCPRDHVAMRKDIKNLQKQRGRYPTP